MARRRRRKSSLVPWIVVLVLVLGAVALWRFLPELKSRFSSGATAPAPAASDTLDVCGFVPSAAVAQALGVDAVEARHLGAGPEVPAEGTCTWNFRRDGKEGRAVALVFTRASLKRGGHAARPGAGRTSAVSGAAERLKRDHFGSITRIEDARGVRIRRDTADASAGLRWFARYAARREAHALRALAGVAGVPALIHFDGRALERSYLDGRTMPEAQPRDPAWFRSAHALLRALRARGVAHNDLAKEANWP